MELIFTKKNISGNAVFMKIAKLSENRRNKTESPRSIHFCPNVLRRPPTVSLKCDDAPSCLNHMFWRMLEGTFSNNSGGTSYRNIKYENPLRWLRRIYDPIKWPSTMPAHILKANLT